MLAEFLEDKSEKAIQYSASVSRATASILFSLAKRANYPERVAIMSQLAPSLKDLSEDPSKPSHMICNDKYWLNIPDCKETKALELLCDIHKMNVSEKLSPMFERSVKNAKCEEKLSLTLS